MYEEADVMEVKSGFLKGIISSIAKKIAKKKLGKNIDLNVYGLKVEIKERKAKLYLEVEVEMPKEDLKSLIFEKIGI